MDRTDFEIFCIHPHPVCLCLLEIKTILEKVSKRKTKSLTFSLPLPTLDIGISVLLLVNTKDTIDGV